MAQIMIEGMVSIPMPMAMGMAPRSSISGTMDMRKMEKYLRNIASPMILTLFQAILA